MIGSVPSRRKVDVRRRVRGFNALVIARIRTPHGLDFGADGPEENAVTAPSVLIAVRRGRPLTPGWTPRPLDATSPARRQAVAAPGAAPAAREPEERA